MLARRLGGTEQTDSGVLPSHTRFEGKCSSQPPVTHPSWAQSAGEGSPPESCQNAPKMKGHVMRGRESQKPVLGEESASGLAGWAPEHDVSLFFSFLSFCVFVSLETAYSWVLV